MEDDSIAQLIADHAQLQKDKYTLELTVKNMTTAATHTNRILQETHERVEELELLNKGLKFTVEDMQKDIDHLQAVVDRQGQVGYLG